MAFTHGKNVYINLANAAGVPTDISSYSNKVDFPRTAETAETTTFGADDKTYLPGLKGANISIEGFWDPIIDALLDGILGKSVAFIYGPQGSSGTNVKYSGNAICTAYNPPGSVGDAVKWTASFIITGAVVRGAF